MKKELNVYFDDILECIEIIGKYIKNVGWQDFENDTQMQDAVIWRLEIIGEAVKKIPESARKENPGTPWKQIADFCDILVHKYDEVVLEHVWRTAHEDLALLKSGVQAILKKKN